MMPIVDDPIDHALNSFVDHQESVNPNIQDIHIINSAISNPFKNAFILHLSITKQSHPQRRHL